MCAALARGFPLSTRPGTGFQKSPAKRLHRAANDNRRTVYNPGPGGFGKRGRIEPFKRPNRLGALRGVPRALIRRIPWVAFGLGAIELAEYWLYQPPGLPHYDMTGWTRLCYSQWEPSELCIAMGHPTGAGYSASNSQTSTPLCTTNSQPLTNGGAWGVDPIPEGRRTVRIGPMIAAGAPSCFVRFNIREHWTRPNNQPAPEVPLVPGRRPVYIPYRDPANQPWLDPDLQPINQPAPDPNWNKGPWGGLPYQPNQDYRGPHRQAGPGPAAASPSPPSNPRPPEPGEKERKLSPKLIIGKGALELALSAAGESADLINAVYNALPWWRRGQMRRPKGQPDAKKVYREIPRSLTDKAGMVYDHFDEVDLAKALKNVVTDQIEDAVLGRIGRIAGRASAASGVRIQVGPAL